MARILLIDDDGDLRCFLQAELEEHGHAVQDLERAEQGPEVLSGAPFDLVLLDNKMPGMSGIDFLEALKERGVHVPVILMTGHSTCDTAIQAMNLGAFDYVLKPDNFQSLFRKLQPLIAEVLAITRPAKDVRVSAEASAGPAPGPTLIGQSPKMIEVYKHIGRFAQRRRRAHPRRDGDRQGAGRPRHPHQQPAQDPAVRRPQQHLAQRNPAGERIVRPREGRVHRGRQGAQGEVRARQRRDAFPGRNRRHAAQAPGQAAAHAGVSGGGAGRRR